MSRGDLLALAAMKKGLAELEAKAEKARAAEKACIDAPGALIALHREAVEVMRDVAAKPRESLKKLEDMKAREEAIRRHLKQDLVKLMDKTHAAEWDASALREHIAYFEMNLRFRGVLKEEGSKTK